MTATWRKKFVKLLVGFAALYFCGCGEQQCQPPTTQPFTSFVGQMWRLISTTDPSASFQGLNNFNTLLFEWNSDFSGDVFRLQYNTELTTPVLTFVYQPNPQATTMEVQYSVPGTTDANGDTTPSSPGATVNYNYQLNTGFVLTDSQKGYTYTFVPFDGDVQPDQICTFSAGH
jgi:hypothetical protein